MVELSSVTYMGVPIVSIGMFALSLLLIIVASNFNLDIPYYMAFFFFFIEFIRLVVEYPFGDTSPIIWGLRGLFVLAIMFMIPKVFTTYMGGSDEY